MRKFHPLAIAGLIIVFSHTIIAQDYYLGKNGPYDKTIPSPEDFLGYEIGAHHTRYDRIVSYFEKLAQVSDKVSLEEYGMTYEYRPLIILTISDPENMNNLEQIRESHLKLTIPGSNAEDIESLPVFINLGYGVHGNEPSSAEAAMLTAYTLVASHNPEIQSSLKNSVIFIDPTINPDGRDRHTEWVNMYKADPLVSDPMDAEHNENWPRGRTNHYWFDLNRDWFLAIHPESRGKLKWYHHWYPNVVTDFHEMGSNSSYFFEPMKNNASKDPIMPKENYTILNDTFAKYYQAGLDSIGSLYFTKEVFDGTYPGYGSTYPDLQGGLALLFEQASSRGHIQETLMGKLTFPFTIRNQYTSSLATIKASVENKQLLNTYQSDFFNSAISRANKNQVKAYVFGDGEDRNRTLAFLDKLLIHKVKVYKLGENITQGGRNFSTDDSFLVPTSQPQYRMVQSMFETYNEFVDSVFYDASAWSLANFYNIPYAELTDKYNAGDEVTSWEELQNEYQVDQSGYAYLISWNDYNATPLLYFLQKHGVKVSTSFKPFQIAANGKTKNFDYGTLMIPVKKQTIPSDSLFSLLESGSEKFKVNIHSVNTGYSISGIDLGSGNIKPLKKPEALMLIGNGVSSYEAGEVWHLMDQRIHMPITKIKLEQFDNIEFHKYNVLVMVSGSYSQLDSIKQQKIKSWISTGNTLITIRQASSWAIKQKLVEDSLVEKDKNKKDSLVVRQPYVDARENIGKERIGGIILKVDLDLSHPLCFGYTYKTIPVYRNSTVWIAPSKNPYATVAKYTDDPLIDGYITDKNLNEFLKPSASLIVSKVGSGRVVMFADNPNFRGSWYGTNRLFLNAMFFGQHIRIPDVSNAD